MFDRGAGGLGGGDDARDDVGVFVIKYLTGAEGLDVLVVLRACRGEDGVA